MSPIWDVIRSQLGCEPYGLRIHTADAAGDGSPMLWFEHEGKRGEPVAFDPEIRADDPRFQAILQVALDSLLEKLGDNPFEVC